MSRVTEFGIMAVFQSDDGRLTVQPQMMFPSEDDAKRAAEIFAEVLGGAVAFSRVVDREAGSSEDGVIIAKFGVMAERSGQGSPHAASRNFSRRQARSPIRDNPERYILTFFEAQLRLCALARATRRGQSKAFPRIWDGTGETKLRSRSPSAEDHAHLPSITGEGELLALQARCSDQLDATGPDARWFMKMTRAWAFTLAGADAEAALRGALACAIEADEEAFFDRVLAPWIAHRFRERAADGPQPELDGFLASARDAQPRLRSTASSRG